jgi:hypothetical protein
MFFNHQDLSWLYELPVNVVEVEGRKSGYLDIE